jgi:hypothetical protein
MRCVCVGGGRGGSHYLQSDNRVVLVQLQLGLCCWTPTRLTCIVPVCITGRIEMRRDETRRDKSKTRATGYAHVLLSGWRRVTMSKQPCACLHVHAACADSPDDKQVQKHDAASAKQPWGLHGRRRSDGLCERAQRRVLQSRDIDGRCSHVPCRLPSTPSSRCFLGSGNNSVGLAWREHRGDENGWQRAIVRRSACGLRDGCCIR